MRSKPKNMHNHLSFETTKPTQLHNAMSKVIDLQKFVDLSKFLWCCIVRVNEVSAVWNNKALRSIACGRIKRWYCSCSLITRIIALATAEGEVMLANDNVDWSSEIRRRCEDIWECDFLPDGVRLFCRHLVVQD